jgi:hypothetical protein
VLKDHRDFTTVLKSLALWGIAACMAMALNTVIFVVLAAFHGHKITLEFNCYHEHLFEVVLCIACFGWGIWGFFYFLTS